MNKACLSLFFWLPNFNWVFQTRRPSLAYLQTRTSPVYYPLSIWSLPTKVHLVKAMVFPVVMCGCESWTIKKAEHQRIDAFELWCWRRLLRVPWTARRSNQPILKEISPEYSLEGLMLKLKLQYLATLCKELTHWKRFWCWERLKTGRERDTTGWDGWMASPTHWTWVSKFRELVMDREACCAAVHRVSRSRTWLSDWTTTKGDTKLSKSSYG